MSSQQNLTAFIYDKKGRVLSIGKNSYTKTHPYMAQLANQHNEPDKVFLHAEVDAIIRCRDIASAHRIFVTRLSRNGQYAMARPCQICMTAINATPISKVEHT
jgi:deoxycytidylate deaminase